MNVSNSQEFVSHQLNASIRLEVLSACVLVASNWIKLAPNARITMSV